MNKYEYDVLRAVYKNPNATQRDLAEDSGCSLGFVCQALKRLKSEGYLRGRSVTDKCMSEIKSRSPKNAVILAAGFGLRMAPINFEEVKGLIQINGEPLIERLIAQLHEAGVTDVSVVVGYMKERYEYLIDKYSVRLIVNPDYAVTNNLHSLKHAISRLGNTYIVPCDLWFKENPFSACELYSWYAVGKDEKVVGGVSVNKSGEIVKIVDNRVGRRMIGLAYIDSAIGERLIGKIEAMCQKHAYDNVFWEEAMFDGKKSCVFAREFDDDSVAEINTYEQLREFDAQSKHLQSKAITVAAQLFGVAPDGIKNVRVLKKGMTNRSFVFECLGKEYIMRIPGEGTSDLIDRRQEYAVYKTLDGSGICDNVVYINPDNGYKITEYWQGARVCDSLNFDDVACCMKKLRAFHESGLAVEHCFDLFGQIDKYEALRGVRSSYADYQSVKERVFSLKKIIDGFDKRTTLTHIDAVPDNFLFVDIDGKSEIKLIDWEYAGMQDPHVDIAMFCIYAMYDGERIDKTIELYFADDGVSEKTRTKIYCYIAVCGLLWSNWCEYKRSLGVDFGEYSLAQYRYAKVYSEKALLRAAKENVNE